MKKLTNLILMAGVLLTTGLALADTTSKTQNLASDQKSRDYIVSQVRHQLLMIPWVNVFDDLSFKVDGNTVTLMGEVRNPVIKDEAQAAVKHIEGVEQVKNQIEVLPVSFNDDRIRLQVARAIFRDPEFSQYAIQPVAPIHIIVKNGHVNLEGVVRTQMDKNVAGIRANGVPGVFSLQNDLQVENATRASR
jgi:hyperosmotically inducible periplasmic protein